MESCYRKIVERVFLSACLIMVVSVVFAQNSFRINERWEFVKGDLGGIWESVRPVSPGSPESLPIWKEVTLPHSWNNEDAVDPGVNYHQGPGWYRTLLVIQNPYERGRTLLHFEGAGPKTEVYIFTKLVGSHVGGYDEFTIDITDAINEFFPTAVSERFKGKVPLSIRCDNSRDLEMIPSDLSDFNIYGGIYRSLNMVYVPSLSVSSLFVSSVLSDDRYSAKISVSASWLNPDRIETGNVEIRLIDPNGQEILSTSRDIGLINGEQQLWQTEIVQPILWSTPEPELYTCKLVLKSATGEHDIQENFGIRNFEFEEYGPFYLNGERLLLRGTHRHEDHAGVGPAMTDVQMKAEMELMKAMGVNFIRLGHYQQSRTILNLCDSLGILVWEEIPWCRGGLGGEIYKEQARRMLTNMITQHRNHPSVIIWGLGNENDWPGDFPEFDQQKIRIFMQELHSLAHQLDPSRKTAIRRCAFCKDIVDVYSPSIWAGWYRGKYSDYRAVSEKEMKDVRHFLHVEWGGDSHAGRHSEDPDQILVTIASGQGADERAGDASLYGGSIRVSKDGDWSETYICNLIDWHLKEQEIMPWLTGTAYWPFKDFSTPIRPENPVPYVNQKGVVERDLTPKDSYYVFQSYWADKPMARIYSHTWPVRWGGNGEVKMVKVYSNCQEAELFLNGRSMGVKLRNSQNFPAAGLRWSVVFENGENHLEVVAKKGSDVVRDELTLFYQTDKWDMPSKMVFEKIATEDDVVTLQVRLLDENNILCLDAKNYVKFFVAGDGKLIKNQGTSTGSRIVQTYNGRAIIRVKINGNNVVAGVKSEGMATVLTKI
ncbi:glycoside hydrolase family 2 protein [Gaoshiqia sp. Z1-71]|uniref:glycoside hydrolase family 2 protein n=1 Tax=Gaoshiqia hydrogeniformans TaxID=3290090 RepID=UPI003BF8AF2A